MAREKTGSKKCDHCGARSAPNSHNKQRNRVIDDAVDDLLSMTMTEIDLTDSDMVNMRSGRPH